MEKQTVQYNVLSIDAWAEGDEGGWTWNAWYKVGTVEPSFIEGTDAEIIARMVDAGYIKASGADKCAVDDDGYNVVFSDSETGEPVFAIEYGPHV